MKVLVTGGGGFLGAKICEQLRARGDIVFSVSRSFYPELDKLGVFQYQGDIAKLDIVREAIDGVDAVIHNAAKAGAWGAYEDYYNANVVGTNNVIEAMREQCVPKLVYTSTPSVTHRATNPVAGLSAQQVPYGENLKAAYASTKKIAEINALAANDSTLAVTALRPRLIWGVGDNHLLPRLVERARAGKLRLIGRGDNLVDATYVDNAAQAHLQALDALDFDSRNAGKAYFISNGEPQTMKHMVNAMLQAAGAPPCNSSIPYPIAMAVAKASEWAYNKFDLKGEPLLTQFLVEQMVTTHWYDMTPAREDFGYVPAVSFEEGVARMREFYLNHPL